MEIVDAQIHIWEAHTSERPWPEHGFEYAHGVDSFTAAHVLGEMDDAGVARAVLVPPSFEGDYNDVCLAAAAQHPDRFAVMGRFRLQDEPDPDRVSRWRETPGMLGMRLTFTRGESKTWFEDGRTDWFWPAAEAARLPLMVHMPYALGSIRTIAERHPALPLIIDHVGIRGAQKDEQIDPSIEQVIALADLANVAVKVSALTCVVSDPYPFPSLVPRIERILSAFGSVRCFWGTDLSRLPHPYADAIRFFMEELPFLSEDDKRQVMGAAILDWLRWPAAG